MAPIVISRGIIFDCETIALGKSGSVPAPFRSARSPTIPYSLKLTRTTNSTAPTICLAPSDEPRDDWTAGLSIALAIFYICIMYSSKLLPLPSKPLPTTTDIHNFRVLWIALNVRLSTNAEPWANERFMRLNRLLKPLTFNDWRAKWSRPHEHRPKSVPSPISLDPDWYALTSLSCMT